MTAKFEGRSVGTSRATAADLPSRLGSSSTRVLLAVVDGAHTHGQLMERVGINRSTVNFHLHRLKRAGFVTWTEGERGTIRPLLRRVA